MQHHHHSQRALGFPDIIAAAILFGLITWGLQAGLDRAVPGLLKPETLLEVRISGGMFILFWALLGGLLIKPFVNIAIEREEKTSGALAVAAENMRQSKEIVAQLEAELKELRIHAIAERDAMAEAAKKEAQKTIEGVLNAAERERKKGAEVIAGLKSEAAREIYAEAEKLSLLVVERALGQARPVRLIH